MFYIYIVISAAAIPILNNFFNIFGYSYSWWLAPVLMLGIFIGLIILQLAVLAIWILTINTNKPVKCAKGFRFIVKHSIPLLLKLARVKVNVIGEEMVPENGRFLFVSNHQHDFDPVIILSVFPDYDIGFIGKKEIYTEMPFIAKAMHGLYSLPIDRENNREAAKTIIEAVRIIKADKASIALFPEGYTSKTCELLPLRTGSLKIAYKADVPIVVCVLNNTRTIPKNIFRRTTTVEFRVLSVINPNEFKDLSTVELGDIIHSQMKKELDALRNN